MTAAMECRHALRATWAEAFDDGVRRALNDNREYPIGFAAWPLEKRNAWFAGFNVGYTKRARQ